MSVRQRCIYCLKEAEFDSEHVIPRCAIKSIRNAPALYGEVCALCNNHFGYIDSITAPFALTAVLTALDGRNTRYGDLENFGVSHCAVRIRTRAFPMLDGARCFVSSTASTGYTMHLEPRIALLKTDHGFDMIHPERLSRFVSRPFFKGVYTGKGVFVSLSDPAGQTAQQPDFELIPLSEQERLLAVQVMHEALENQINRAVAKMSFNFLAWIAGRRKYHRHRIELHSGSFDGLRAFVRGGITETPIARRVRNVFERDGKMVHYIRLCVESSGPHCELVAYVGLFDLAQWRVRLTAIDQCDFPYDIRYEWDFASGGCSWKRA
jgi:hypothetical protein